MQSSLSQCMGSIPVRRVCQPQTGHIIARKVFSDIGDVARPKGRRRQKVQVLVDEVKDEQGHKGSKVCGRVGR